MPKGVLDFNGFLPCQSDIRRNDITSILYNNNLEIIWKLNEYTCSVSASHFRRVVHVINAVPLHFTEWFSLYPSYWSSFHHTNVTGTTAVRKLYVIFIPIHYRKILLYVIMIIFCIKRQSSKRINRQLLIIYCYYYFWIYFAPCVCVHSHSRVA